MEMWSYSHRGISPLPPTHPRIGRHSPWEERGNAGGLMVSMQDSAVRNFLPGLRYHSLAGSNDMRMLIEQLVATSEETMPHTKWNPLDKEELRSAYKWILRALSRVSPGEADYVISHDLMAKLEERIGTDQNDAREINGGKFFHRRSQHLFRCMAEVSCKTESIKLGTILLQFFNRHASLIASTDSSSALAQWCYSILCATARDTDRYECLRKVLRLRPDLPHTIRGRGRKAADVADRLDWVASRAGRRDVQPRRHEQMALYSRHYADDFQDDLDMDMDMGMLGDELAMFGPRRQRGRSRDGLMVPHHHGGLGPHFLDEDAYPGPRLSLPDVHAERGRFERSLLLHEDRDSRMMHLTMGHSYVDPLDVYGMRAGELMAPLEARLPLSSEIEYDI